MLYNNQMKKMAATYINALKEEQKKKADEYVE